VAESALSIPYAELLVEVAAFLGYGVDSGVWTDAQLAEIDRYVQAGVRRFYYPPAMEGVEEGYQWSFLSPVATIATAVDDQAQDLPDLLGRVLGDFHFEQSEHRHSIVQVSEERYQKLVSRSDDTGYPQVARVAHKAQTAGDGQRLEVSWWPVPDAIYTLTYKYEAYAGKLSASNKYPLGGMRHAELLIASCLAIAEQRANDERGMHTEDFARMMKSAIKQDRRLGARHYGHMGNQEKREVIPRHGDTGSSYDITYKAVEY
jgi:hypothetical protein